MSEELMILPTPQQLGELSKKDLTALAKTKAQEVTNSGTLNELEVYIRLKKLGEFVAAMAKGMQGRAEQEARREQEKGKFDKFGATVTHTSGPSKWVYDHCGDPLYEELLDNLEQIKSELKTREAFLQAVPEEGLNFVDGQTGETYTIRRAVKVPGAEGISITY